MTLVSPHHLVLAAQHLAITSVAAQELGLCSFSLNVRRRTVGPPAHHRDISTTGGKVWTRALSHRGTEPHRHYTSVRIQLCCSLFE